MSKEQYINEAVNKPIFRKTTWYGNQNQGRNKEEFSRHLYLGKLAEEYLAKYFGVQVDYNVSGKDGYDLYYQERRINVKYTEFNSWLFSPYDNIFKDEQVFIGLKIIFKDNNRMNIDVRNIDFKMMCVCDASAIRNNIRKPIKKNLSDLGLLAIYLEDLQ